MEKLKHQKIAKIKNVALSLNNLNKKTVYEYNLLINTDIFKILEFQNKNLYLPNILTDDKIIFTIQQEFNNSKLLTYNITYVILLLFHNYISKIILQKKKKNFNKLFLIKQKKKSQNFYDFCKNQQTKFISIKKYKYFFIIFGYIFSLKNNHKIYFKIKNKKFLLYNMIKRKKSTSFEKKRFTFYLLQEEHLTHKCTNIQMRKNKYVLSRIQYLKKYLKINK